MSAADQRPIIVDYVIIICSDCKVERTITPPEPLVGAPAMVVWVDSQLTPCVCGAQSCDVKAHLMELN